MCQACQYPDLYLTIPSAHDRGCVLRSPYLKYESMTASELQPKLPALVQVASEALRSFGEGNATIEEVQHAARESRACSDALAKFKPRKQRFVGTARAAQSWK